MQKVTNTADSPNFEWLMCGNPNAIEAQEAQGQKELVNSSQLPAKVNSPNKVNIEEQYALMGIKVIGKSKGDDLFLDVILPDGWKKESTDHSMWNNLKDDKGRIRATFFYKAAFYDRNSFVNFSTRFNTGQDYFTEEKNPEKDWDNARVVYVIDSSTNEKIFKTEKHFYDGQDNSFRLAKEFLNEKYPDWENINAYWD